MLNKDEDATAIKPIELWLFVAFSFLWLLAHAAYHSVLWSAELQISGFEPELVLLFFCVCVFFFAISEGWYTVFSMPQQVDVFSVLMFN